jgi:polyferredoxin
MPLGAKRERTLYGLGAKRERLHRYTWLRWAVGATCTLGVGLLAWTDSLSIDLWSGRGAWLGRPVGFVEAVKRFTFSFLAINVAIILVSRFLGRWLCGFVCPVGNLARLAEWFQWRGRRGWRRVSGLASSALASGLLAAIAFSFWVDWRVFSQGSHGARLAAGTFLVLTSAGLFSIVEGLGLRFCRDFCPSGVYFAVLGPTSSTGVEFAHPSSCTDCKACESVCPVDLEPRDLAGAPPRAERGFYPSGLSNLANCLRCGDCVVACEGTTARSGDPTPLRLGWMESPEPSQEAPA